MSSNSIGISCFSLSCSCCVFVAFESSVAGGFDDLDGPLCVQRGLKFKPGRNQAVIFTALIKTELLSYSCDSACVGDVVVLKSFALSSK